MNLLNAKTIVIKIGSSLLADANTQSVHMSWLQSLADDLAALKKQNIQVVIVSSGAIALGKIALQLETALLRIDTKQALAAIGQIQLSAYYKQVLHVHNLLPAQILITLEDTEDRKRYINCANTLRRLLELGMVPVINENDTIATSEIRYGDNDRLAARVAQMIQADALILLSDIDGLYTDDPRLNPHAEFIPSVPMIDTAILALAKDSSSNYGSGGMITKLDAARIATQSGCAMLIAFGKSLHPIQHYLDTQKGTWFLPKETAANAKKNWLQEHLKIGGSISVDQGAVDALKRGSSLLPSGIHAVSGNFKKGAAINIIDATGQVIARGLSNYPADDVLKIMGKQTHHIEALLKYDGLAEVVHRDNCVLLGNE